ncbi:hypothetical protein XM53_00640 [Roseovarius atlanticus]|uniref:DUF3887 domain-containing protein n=1 Tax=Roseovarius atlanticus TaxID=1641875 RepID=A0A0T5NZI0_9RHOB|nr:hypothetical protein [Roseovarius atlanticus]KRS14276.1 hypothetical protein XM53_00640 [Roseovarius atlanticus]
MFRLFAALLSLLAVSLATPSTAQEPPESIFRDYEHMRSVMDDGMMNRKIVMLMRAFGASDEMTTEELQRLEAQVQALFPQPLETVEIVKSEKLGENWTREMYVYYSGIDYIYAFALFHTRPDAVIAVNFKFNTDPMALLAEF